MSAYWVGSISTGISSPIRRIINSLTNAINKNAHLPRIIILPAETVLLKHLEYYEFGASKIMGKTLNYLIGEISRMIDTKREDMKSKRPGAVVYGEPKIIWMKIWDRPTSDRVFSLRSKFNAVLEETLANYRSCYILEFEADGVHFDRANNFNNSGKNAFWRYVDQEVKKFDKQIISLKPRKVVSEAKEKEEIKRKKRCKVHATKTTC